jgi:hypothetical protein
VARGGVRVTDKDNGYEALVARIAEARERATVTIGVHQAEGSAPEGEGGATVLDVALFAEFGTTTEPARPFVSGWADENEEANKERLRLIGKRVVSGRIKSTEIGLSLFGLLGVAEVQRRIQGGIAPENADSTIEAKGSSTPLIDTGQLLTSVTFKVNDK